MSLKVVHINREAPVTTPDPVKELAEILVAKWRERDRREAEWMFPGVLIDDDDNPKTA